MSTCWRTAACILLSSAFAFGQYVPNDWIRTKAWNFLILTQPWGCGGGGTDNMTRNWVAPYNIGTDNPYGDNADAWQIDFAAAGVGWNMGTLNTLLPDPTWLTWDFATTGLGISLPDADGLDYQWMVDTANAAGGYGIPSDNIVGIATTYVENTTGDFLPVQVCEGSDDSIQVWINDCMVSNVSYCRGWGGCQEVVDAYLPPGVSKIATLTFEGGGGWGFQLALRDTSGAAYNDSRPEIKFLGAGGADGLEGQPGSFCVSRTGVANDSTCAKDTRTIALNVRGDAPAGLDLTESVRIFPGGFYGPDAVGLDAPGATIADIEVPSTYDPAAFLNIEAFENAKFVGNDAGAGSKSSYDAGTGIYTSISTSGHDIWAGGDDFQFSYTTVPAGVNFDVAIEIVGYEHSNNLGRWGKCGLMARQIGGDPRNNRYTQAQIHGPAFDDASTQTGRWNDHDTGAVYEAWGIDINPRPKFVRLTRRGNVVQAWFSNQLGLADGSLDPCNDVNWLTNWGQDWGSSPEVDVGFANSEHESDGWAVQTWKFRIIGCNQTAPNAVGKQLTWAAGTWSGGVGYSIDAMTVPTEEMPGFTRGSLVRMAIDGLAGPQKRAFSTISDGADFIAHRTEGIGIFEHAHDIGSVYGAGFNPGVQGDTTFDEATGVYTITGAGNDIWDGGDYFQFAYKAVTGDFVATCRVIERTTLPGNNNHQWGRSGLMARWDCNYCSKYSMITEAPRAPNVNYQPQWQYRGWNYSCGGTRNWYHVVDDRVFATGENGREPPWMKIVRKGNAIYGYLADDDGLGNPKQWRQLGGDGVPNLPQTLLVGYALQGRAPAFAGKWKFDNMEIEPLPPEPVVYTVGDVLVGTDFEGMPADGMAPPYADVAVRSGGFSPAIIGGKLRLAQDGIGSSATGVYYDLPGSEALTENGFAAEFDVTITKPGGVNPADGMTFAVVQGRPRGVLTPYDGQQCVEVFDQAVFVGGDVGGASVASYDDTTGVYTNTSTSGQDIWAGGDDFMFQYTEVTGDFDIAIEIVNYTHSTPGVGRWGKSGLMARASLDRCAQFTMAQVHGPGEPDQSRQAGRWSGEGGLTLNCGTMYEDGFNFPAPNVNYPDIKFLRIARRGNQFRAFASKDGYNWRGGRAQSWFDNPEKVLIGFANSEHGDAGAGIQTYQYKILPCPAGSFRDWDGYTGDGGGSLGYGGSAFVWHNEGVWHSVDSPNFAIEFDTWSGGGWPGNEPGGCGRVDDNPTTKYHVGLDIAGEVTSIQTNADFGVPCDQLPPIYNTAGVHAEVIYAPTGQIDVFLTSIDGTVGRTKVLSHRIPPLAGSIVLGFTGGTGGATATFEVDNLFLKSLCAEAPDAVAISGDASKFVNQTANLSAAFTGGDGAVTYEWSTNLGVIAPSGSTATLTSDTAGKALVTVKANDGKCGGAESTFEVEFVSCPAVTAQIEGEPAELKNGESVQLSATVSPSEGIIAWVMVSGPGTLSTTGLLTATADSGDIVVTLKVTLANGCPGAEDTVTVKAIPAGVEFKRGDADQTGTLNLTDAVVLLGYLFLGNPTSLACLDAADADDNNGLNLTDAVVLLGYLFLGNPLELPDPGPVCGIDDDPIMTQACVYSACQ